MNNICFTTFSLPLRSGFVRHVSHSRQQQGVAAHLTGGAAERRLACSAPSVTAQFSVAVGSCFISGCYISRWPTDWRHRKWPVWWFIDVFLTKGSVGLSEKQLPCSLTLSDQSQTSKSSQSSLSHNGSNESHVISCIFLGKTNTYKVSISLLKNKNAKKVITIVSNQNFYYRPWPVTRQQILKADFIIWSV